ncbi:hypothetical protein U27_03319 [Candidatus Vecturithrix granuli]|uniref:SpoVT-AbrB domain-containing protein n=1 Tax=Vecturithrix granuli TaxID=1499967 RepID=A0A081BVK2_VECG1|nr:hypothetical protein U27_03319 [Candidatus Vecturithrix granuli]
MVLTTVQSNHISLPEPLVKRFWGKSFEIIEIKEGILLKPVDDAISLAKGCLKGTGFSSQRFMQLKQTEKELER